MEKRRKSASLLPVGVFLVFYLGLGILFEYIMKIPMGFYNVPIVVAFLAALLVACLQNRKVGFDEKLEIMGRGIGDKRYYHNAADFPDGGKLLWEWLEEAVQRVWRILCYRSSRHGLRLPFCLWLHVLFQQQWELRLGRSPF